MKVFKRLLLLPFLFFSTANLFALENIIEDYLTFSITPQFEIANGQITEYVFDDECKNTDNKLSELDWQIKTLALFSIQGDFDIIKYISLGMSGCFGVTQRSGFMQDSDWKNSVVEVWSEDDPTERTDFSEHINRVNKYISYKFSLGGNIYLPLKIKLTPHATYKYDYIKFVACEGYGIYKQNDFKTTDWKTAHPGTIISYEQEINSFLLGLNVNSQTIPKTIINLNFDFSPSLTTLNAIDCHFTTGSAYLDNIKNVFMIDSDISARYCFTENHSAGLNYRIQYIPLSKGNTYNKRIDKNGNLISDQWNPIGKNTGGTERLIWSLGLNYSFSL